MKKKAVKPQTSTFGLPPCKTGRAALQEPDPSTVHRVLPPSKLKQPSSFLWLLELIGRVGLI